MDMEIMSSSLKAAIHLGQNYTENMAVFNNTDMEEIQNLCSINQRLVLGNTEEILNVQAVESTDPSWIETRMSHPQVIKWTKAKGPRKLRLCLLPGKNVCLLTGNTKMERAADRRWVNYQELLDVDGEPIEFEWNILPGLSSFGILQKIQSDLRSRNIKPENSGSRMISMPMLNDTHRSKRGSEEQMFFKFCRSQGLREEMLARSLDVLWTWR